MKQWTNDASQASVKGAGIAHECLSAAKTVFSLGAEEHFTNRYVAEALPSDK